MPAAQFWSSSAPRKRSNSATSRSRASSRDSCPTPASSVTVAVGSAAASRLVISRAHGGLAVPTSSSSACRTWRAAPARSTAASAWASRGQRRGDDGQDIPPAWCIAQRLHLAACQSDDLGEEGKGPPVGLAIGDQGGYPLGSVALDGLRPGRLVQRDAPERGAAQPHRARRWRRSCGRARPRGHPVRGPERPRHRRIRCPTHRWRRRRWSRGRAGPSRSRAAARSAHPIHAASCRWSPCRRAPAAVRARTQLSAGRCGHRRRW